MMRQFQEVDFMEACRRAKWSPWKLRDAIARGRVGARKDERGRWLVIAEDVDRLVAQPIVRATAALAAH